MRWSDLTLDDLPDVPDVIDLTEYENDIDGMLQAGRHAVESAQRLRLHAEDAYRMSQHYSDLYFAISRRADALEQHGRDVINAGNDRLRDQRKRGSRRGKNDRSPKARRVQLDYVERSKRGHRRR